MLKRDIKYTDFDGNEVTETFYFNISKHEIIELEVGHQGGMEEFLKKMVKLNDQKALFAEFKRLILLSVGQKSPDGKRFVKTEELKQEFEQSAAFDELIMEFFMSEDAAANFVRGVLPSDVSGAMDQATLPPPPNIQPAENLGVHRSPSGPVTAPINQVVEIPDA